MSPATTESWPLAGRETLLTEVVDALVAQRVSAVLLRGPAGVGKSRLAREAAARLPKELPVHRVTATRALSAVPLGALASLLAHASTDVDLSTLDAVRLLAQVRRAVTVAGQGRRLVLLVDDLPWLDPLSMNVIAALLDQDVAALLATARDDEPVPEGLVALWSAGRALRLDVPALDPGACRVLVEASLGGPVAERTVDVLHRHSGGNPLHLRELVAETHRRSRFVVTHSVWRLAGDVVGSPALVELVERRLAALTPLHRDLVERIALCQPLAVDEVAAVTGSASHGLLAEMEEQGLLSLEDGPDGRLMVRLAHPQYEAVLRSSISRLRGAELRLQHATQVEAASPRPGDVLRTGLWRLEATGTADPDVLLRGARLARLAHDFTAVDRLAQAAVRSGDRDWNGLAEAQLLLGEAQRERGHPQDAAVALAAAAAAPASSEVAARVAVLRAYLTADEGPGRGPEALALIDEASARLPGQAPLLLAARADLLKSTHLVTAGLTVLDEAAAAYGRNRASWAPTATKLLSWAGRVDEALAWAERPPATGADSEDDLVHRSDAEMGRAMALLVAGRVDAAVDAARLALSLAVADGMDRSITLAEWQLAAALLHAGRPRTAARWCADAISGAHAHGPRGHIAHGLAGLALSQVWLGNLPGAYAALAELPVDSDPDDPWRLLAECWVISVDGSTDVAVQRLLGGATRAVDLGNAAVATALLHGVVRLGRADWAVDQLEEVARRVHAPVVVWRARHARAAADRNVDALTTVANAWAEMGARLDAAEAAAQAVQAAGATHSPRALAALTARAQQLASGCEGARPVATVVVSDTPLTTREREITLLAARGLPSRDIADRLFLSVRTVNNHLQASYLKLGISSRRELANVLLA